MPISVPDREAYLRPKSFSRVHEEAAREINWDPESAEGRVLVHGITIDPPRSPDLDDAIWLERDRDLNQIRLYVTIPHVSFLIPQGSELDQEAFGRTATIYRGESIAYPMFPHSLTSNKLSLLPGELRPTLTVQATLDADSLEIIDGGVVKSMLKSYARLSYAQASKIASLPESPFHRLIAEAQTIARQLFEMRRSHGALAIFDLQEGYAANEEGKLVSLGRSNRFDSHLIIQEFMILANQVIASLLVDSEIGIFRNHLAGTLAPNRDIILNELDSSLVGPGEIRQLQQKLSSWSTRANYEPEPVGHFGLNLDQYTHATSPIRRYVDLVVQRILETSVFNPELPNTYSPQDIQNICEYVNQRTLDINGITSRVYKRNQHRKEGRQFRRAAQHTPQSLARLDSPKFDELIRTSHKTSQMPEALQAAITLKIEQGQQLSHKSIVILILHPNLDQQVKAELLRGVSPSNASSLLNHLQQAKHTDLSIVESELDSGEFTTTIAEDGKTVIDTTTARSKKMSRGLAAMQYLARIAGVSIELPPDSQPENHINQTARLNEYCQNNGIQQATYESQTKNNQGTIETTVSATLEYNGSTLQASATAPSKKVAKRVVAGKLLEQLSSFADRESLPTAVDDSHQSESKIIEVPLDPDRNYIGELNSLRQVNRITALSFEFRVTTAGLFVCSCNVTANDGTHITTQGGGPKKQAAKHQAAAKMTEQLSACTYKEEQQTDQPSATTAPPTENHVGNLNEFLVSAAIQGCSFEIISTGPSHSPLFSCTYSVEYSGQNLAVTAEATTKKHAKHFAAQALMDQLLPLYDETATIAPEPEEDPQDDSIEVLMPSDFHNYIGDLIELGQKKRYSKPSFTFSKTTSGQFLCAINLTVPDEEVAEPLIAQGQDNNKKRAKQAAAKNMLNQLQELQPPQSYTDEFNVTLGDLLGEKDQD